MPSRSAPFNTSTMEYGSFLSPALNSNGSAFKLSAEKYFPNKSFARITFTGFAVYGLNVLTKTYSMFFPTAKAVFEGNVQGVVVQARKKVSSGNDLPDFDF